MAVGFEVDRCCWRRQGSGGRLMLDQEDIVSPGIALGGVEEEARKRFAVSRCQSRCGGEAGSECGEKRVFP